ncbi:unnamed protein product [Strongylus vulgaris]|uniref:Autophagy-related protein 11 C-terminal domain-containing protein n=1 Tax=Strongylus vulgaris TaxID=40348 RepID=A0A3P7LB41_STRVU|nr:unnamed protein product [Strongylus vulgaris]
MSEKSSQFSTPDDHFHTADPIEERVQREERKEGNKLDISLVNVYYVIKNVSFAQCLEITVQQFPVDDLTSRSQTFYEALKPAAVQILSLSKDMLDLRAELTKNYDFFLESFSKLGELTGSALADKMKQVKDHYDAELAKVTTEQQNFVSELQHQVEDYGKLEALHREEKEAIVRDLALQQSEVQRLASEALRLEEKVKAVRSETYKEGIIAMELEKNRLSTEYEEVIEGKDAQIRQLQKELEKKNAEINRLQSDPESEAFRRNVIAEIRNELEKESKSKLELLTKGITQKKDEECSRLRKELEYEMRIMEIEKNCSLKWLAAERDRLREYIINKLPEGESVCNTVEEEIMNAVTAEQGEYKTIYGSSTATQTDISYPGAFLPAVLPVIDEATSSQYADMRESVFAVENVPMAVEESVFIPGDAPVADTERKGVGVQTRIGLRAMDRMVAVEDIVEGSTVLVIWNDRHNAYMLFSYRLPVDTRVYRVDVEPLEGRLPRTERAAT